jgi:hypothetical protein
VIDLPKEQLRIGVLRDRAHHSIVRTIFEIERALSCEDDTDSLPTGTA